MKSATKTQRNHLHPVGQPTLDPLVQAKDGAARDVMEWFGNALLQGTPWPLALLEAIGRWPLAQEEIDGVQHQYLLLGEAFDWLTLAGRLLGDIDGLVSQEDKEALLFQSRLPQEVSEAEFRSLVGPEKYRAHLNYFYGVIVEESLLLAAEEEVLKERASRGLRYSEDVVELAHRRLYGDSREGLLRIFRQELSLSNSLTISITELKEFTYWLFKRRVNSSDSSRVASDTKKGLERLFRMNGA